MKSIRQLIFRNLLRRPVRSLALGLLAAVLSAAILDGTVILQSMRNGISAMEDRLGADIMVVPYAALSKKSFENEPLLGNTGNYYLSADTCEGIGEVEGIRRSSSQFYLTAVDSDACDSPVHLISYDPETDFTVTPWITEADERINGSATCVIGADIHAQPGDTLEFFGIKVRVRAKMGKTGTDYDTSAFMDRASVHLLAEASGDEKLNAYDQMDSGKSFSCTLIDTKEGYDTESVKNDINIHFKKLRAIQSRKLMTSVASGMGGISKTSGILIAAVWIIAAAVLAGAYAMLTSERSRELALFRVLGAARGQVTGIVTGEALVLCIAGGLAGITAGLAAVPVFAGGLEKKIQVPFLPPSAGQIAAFSLLATLITAAAGCVSAGISAQHIRRIDTGVILRSRE